MKVLVVEDSVTVRKRLVEVLEADTEIHVVGEAEDGKTAIELAQSLRPDVITLDMMLPVMTGLAVTEYVMAYCPTPILIVSSSTNRGELFRTYDALAAGALDVLEKGSGPEWERKFVDAVKLVSRIRVITHVRGRLAKSPPTVQTGDVAVVGVGASTGGAGAVAGILRSLPSSFRIPILLVVHIGRPFGEVFAEWLDGQSSLRVSYAEHGQPLPSRGCVLMAPPDYHLVLRQGKLYRTRDPERHSCRPSVDVLFESLAREAGSRAAGCLLTGMGRDGAEGLLRIRQAGGRTFAQDEATSVVYGMPREAVQIGAAERVLPLDAFAGALEGLA